MDYTIHLVQESVGSSDCTRSWGGGHWQKFHDLTRRISHPHTTGCKIRALIDRWVLAPMLIGDLLSSSQASMELDRVEPLELKISMPEMSLVCVLL